MSSEAKNVEEVGSMEIAFIHYTGPPKEVAGVERVIEFHTRYLIDDGYVVHLVYGRGGGFGNERVIEHKVPYLDPEDPYVTKVQEEILNKGRTASFVALKEAIKRSLKQIVEKVDCCVVHNIPSTPYNFAATSAINELAEEMDARFVFWLHDIVIFRKIWRPYLGKFPFTLLNRYIPKTKYVAVSEFIAEQFKNAPPPYRIPEITVVHNGVDVAEYGKIDREILELYQKFGIGFDDIVLLCPVRITPRKNLEYAIRVMSGLNTILGGERRAVLLVSGPPEHMAKGIGRSYFNRLQGLAKELEVADRVFFCHKNVYAKRIHNEDGKVLTWSIGDLYTIADVVLVTSVEEGFGLPLLEAGAARKPVFCSSIPPFKETVRHEIEGYVFDLNEDARNVAQKIYEYLAHDYAASNFKNVLKRFTWNKIIEDVKRILED